MQTKTQVLVVACVVVLTLTAGTAQAQRRGFGFGVNKLQIAAVAEVAQELKFDEEQTALAKKLSEDDREQSRSLFQDAGDLTQEQRREKFQELQTQRTEREQQLEKSLGEEKAKRLGQLALQAAGLTRAIGAGEVREKVGVTREQLTQIREAGQGLREQFRSAGNDAEARAKVQKDYEAKITGLLTDEQKTKWKELIGKPAGEELLEKIRTATSPRRRRDT